MGVMECSRVGCEAIGCHLYSSKFGYLCGDCFGELVDSNPNKYPVTRAEIDGFLETDKSMTNQEEVLELRKTFLEKEFNYERDYD